MSGQPVCKDFLNFAAAIARDLDVCRPTCSNQFNYSSAVSLFALWLHDCLHFLALLIGWVMPLLIGWVILFVITKRFCLVWCSHFQVVISTDTRCMFCGCRFSHLQWLQHKLANDTALAMHRTEQILCLSFILNVFLAANFLLLPAGQHSLPRLWGASCSS
jgi:hypothetical protein